MGFYQLLFTIQALTPIIAAQSSRDRINLNVDFQPSFNLPLEGKYPISDGQEVIINVRPEDMELHIPPSDSHLMLKVYTSLPAGSEALTYLRTQNEDMEFIIKGPEDSHRNLRPEMEVGLHFKKGNIYDAASETLLGSFPPDCQRE